MPGRKRSGAEPIPLALTQTARPQAAAAHAPLAARMRPRSLEEFEGQEHLVGERGVLRRAVARGHLPSMVLWGPPGSGKTTLARLLADAIGAPFATLSAVMSGVVEVRKVIAEARETLAAGGEPTVLFIDEIHRFNKAQQDALLPQVEDGTITLIGATTENPYFEVNSALLSRLRVFRLEPLTDEQVSTVVQRALVDERGFGGRVGLGQKALEHLVNISGGDARGALNVLEAAAAIAESAAPDRASDGGISPTLEEIEVAAQQRVLAYDRAGDGHYDTVSAFIKSLRGNDPDAALYWLATMVAAGEDPRFIARRMIISASEDVGNADPRALQVAVAAAHALDWVGLPEAQYALAHAAAYIASAPKSNRAGLAYWSAMSDVQEHGSLPVPMHLRSGTWRERRDHGIGVGYRYPHDYPDADVDQQYLPEKLSGRRYYEPSSQGMESQIGDRLARVRSSRKGSGGTAGAAGGEPPPPESDRSSAHPHGSRPKADAMKTAGNVMRDREDRKRRMAEAQKREASE
jgi:putative ATPase